MGCVCNKLCGRASGRERDLAEPLRSPTPTPHLVVPQSSPTPTPDLVVPQSSPTPNGSTNNSRGRTRSGPDGKVRTVCQYGTRCYRRNPEHLKAESHPYDDDYLDCCRAANKAPEIVTIRKLFHWCDSGGKGKASRKDVVTAWPQIKQYGDYVPDLDDNLWNQIDEDGNGWVNFTEFVQLTKITKVDLPVGLDDLKVTKRQDGQMRCGVYDCKCRNFEVRRRRCKYGDQCYTQHPDQHQEHLNSFCHPGDPDWACVKVNVWDANMCACGHKKQLHRRDDQGHQLVDYPAYWASVFGGSFTGTESNQLVEVTPEMLVQLQQLLDDTYSNKFTRDRKKHNGTGGVPKNFILKQAWRNENCKLWRKYCIRKAELTREKQIANENPNSATGDLAYQEFDDVKTSKALEKTTDLADRMDTKINEWYLYHGTSASAANDICSKDFKLRLAGTATGTLYGCGSYFAESITKADEYAKAESGSYTVLLCRVLGGRVKYTAEVDPNPEELTKACVEGPFDCIVGDRVKCRGTYREFVVFDTDNIYPEYILKYDRGELSSSAHAAS